MVEHYSQQVNQKKLAARAILNVARQIQNEKPGVCKTSRLKL
jgi:hypothetical protein